MVARARGVLRGRSRPEEAPTRQEREELARAVYERPVVVERPQVSVDDLIDRTPQATVAPPLPLPERVITPPAPRVVARPPAPVAPVEPLREVAPPAPPMPAPAPVEIEIEADEENEPAMGAAPVDDASTEGAAPKRRGRPRGRPRRQVHFHVDPDEERLLMLAVERYGSQQKGLIAALESLQEADLLRDEISVSAPRRHGIAGCSTRPSRSSTARPVRSLRYQPGASRRRRASSAGW